MACPEQVIDQTGFASFKIIERKMRSAKVKAVFNQYKKEAISTLFKKDIASNWNILLKFLKSLEKPELSPELSRDLVEHFVQFNNFFWFHGARHAQSRFNREFHHHLSHFLFFFCQLFWSLAGIFIFWT